MLKKIFDVLFKILAAVGFFVMIALFCAGIFLMLFYFRRY